jgi:hypothetical protein
MLLKIWILIVFCILPFTLTGQMEKYIEEDPPPVVKYHRGLVYNLMETGSGLGLFYEVPFPDYYHLGLAFDFLMIRDNSQLDGVDYYGRPYSIGKENNVFLFDLMGTVKKRLFTSELDDSFRPFILASFGPVYGMNFPEYPTDIYQNKTRKQFAWSLAGTIGIGLDADVEGGYFFGFRTQYRIMPFPEKIGETKNHSMIDIRFEVGQRF